MNRMESVGLCEIQKDDKTILHLHHIDYNKQNSIKNNLVFLCNSCHSKTNYNREYYSNLLRKDCDKN